MRLRTAVAVLSCATSLAAQADDGPYTMRYGPLLTTTVECGGIAGTTRKGLVIRCGDRGTVVFDTELLRVSSAWTDGWLRLRGTAYDGAHGPMPGRLGVPVVETTPGPGWAHGGGFADPRELPYGPLPAAWGRFEAAQLVEGDGVVVDYRTGDMKVREQFGFDENGAFVRTLELGPSAHEQLLVVADVPGGAAGEAAMQAPGRFAMLQWSPLGAGSVAVDAAPRWNLLATGCPQTADYLDLDNVTGATLTAVSGFAAPDAELSLLHDGDGGSGVRFVSMANGDEAKAARLLVDLKRTVPVARIDLFAGGRKGRAPALRCRLYGSEAELAPDAAAEHLRAAGWRELGEVDSSGLPPQLLHGAVVGGSGGLGTQRHLLLVVDPDSGPMYEIDVWADHSRLDPSSTSHQQFCALHGDQGPELTIVEGRMLLRVPLHDAVRRVQLVLMRGIRSAIDAGTDAAMGARTVAALSTTPAPKRWGEPLVTHGSRGPDDGPFAVDTITIPFDNPFHSRMRTAAFDFFADGRAAVSTWNGDVWIVDGIDDDLDQLTWRRFATGLFDPLGLRIVGDVVHVLGRDGITRLHDTDGDGEADRHENFCNGVLITDAFHEFAFDLQTDADGNFFFSKGAPVKPGGRGFEKIVPHHGAILKVSPDGERIEAIATGLRAPNGIGVSPTGIVTSGDNEGTFMPRCRINWITKPGFYAGVRDTAHRSPVPVQPDLPLCWLPMEVDNSSGGQVWVTGAAWPDLAGRLLHLSYGTCSAFLVLTEEVDGRIQGGVVRLPAEFSSSCMRGRFSPRDGQLYVIGLQGWQTSAAREGGFHRVRRTAAPLGIPIALRTCTDGVYLTFAEELDAATATDVDSFGVEIWNYLYSPNYGSPELSLLHPERQVEQGKPNRDALSVTAARLSPDRHTVFVAVAEMRPVHQMRITWNVDAADGRQLKGDLHHTIHALAADPGFPGSR